MACTHPVTEPAEPQPDVLPARGEHVFAPVSQTEHPSSLSSKRGMSCPRESRASSQELCFPTLELLRGPSKEGNVPTSHVLICVSYWQQVSMTSFLPLWAFWTSTTIVLLSTPHTGDVMLGPTHCPPNVDVLLRTRT